MEERTGCIYKITCVPNGRVYIGQTVQNIKVRFQQHMYKHNKKMEKDIKKHNWSSFIYEIISSNVPENKLNDLEIETIKEFTPYYNINKGGTYGKQKIGEDNFNTKFSDTKIREIRKKWSSKEYTQEQLANDNNTTQAYISSIVLGRSRKDSGGIIATAHGNNDETHPSCTLSNKIIKEIRVEWSTGKYIRKEIMLKYSISKSYLSDVLCGKVRISAGGPTIEKIVQKKLSNKEVERLRILFRNSYLKNKLLTYKSFVENNKLLVSCKYFAGIIRGSERKLANGPIKGVDY